MLRNHKKEALDRVRQTLVECFIENSFEGLSGTVEYDEISPNLILVKIWVDDYSELVRRGIKVTVSPNEYTREQIEGPIQTLKREYLGE